MKRSDITKAIDELVDEVSGMRKTLDTAPVYHKLSKIKNMLRKFVGPEETASADIDVREDTDQAWDFEAIAKKVLDALARVETKLDKKPVVSWTGPTQAGKSSWFAVPKQTQDKIDQLNERVEQFEKVVKIVEDFGIQNSKDIRDLKGNPSITDTNVESNYKNLNKLDEDVSDISEKHLDCLNNLDDKIKNLKKRFEQIESLEERFGELEKAAGLDKYCQLVETMGNIPERLNQLNAKLSNFEGRLVRLEEGTAQRNDEMNGDLQRLKSRLQGLSGSPLVSKETRELMNVVHELISLKQSSR